MEQKRTQYTIFLKRLSFEANTSEIIVWSIVLQDLELLAGMLSISPALTYDLHSGNTEIEYNLDSNTDVSEFRLLHNIAEENVYKQSGGKLVDGEYGVWIRGRARGLYDLYHFRTNSFFQGIVSICHKFHVDFRNYIFGLPFDKYGNQYTLEDYIMVPFQVVQDAPDLEDVDEEEYDDENQLQLLERTDEIVYIK